MISASSTRSQPTVREFAARARTASRALAKLSDEHRNKILMAAAKAIENGNQKILEANERDCRAAEPAVAAGKMSSAMFARLRAPAPNIAVMAARVRDVARLADPLGRRLSATHLADCIALY